MSLREKVKERAIIEEGFRSQLYYCTANKPTIGYGFNLENGIPKKIADLWLDYLLEELDRDVRKAFPNFSNYPFSVQEALMDMAYNMGLSKLLKFKKTLRLIDEGNYLQAGKELLNSQYAKDVPNRALRNSRLIKGAL